MARLPLVGAQDSDTPPLAHEVLQQVTALRNRAVEPNEYRAVANHPEAGTDIERRVESGGRLTARR